MVLKKYTMAHMSNGIQYTNNAIVLVNSKLLTYSNIVMSLVILKLDARGIHLQTTCNVLINMPEIHRTLTAPVTMLTTF